jgi:hypothetical protein
VRDQPIPLTTGIQKDTEFLGHSAKAQIHSAKAAFLSVEPRALGDYFLSANVILKEIFKK